MTDRQKNLISRANLTEEQFQPTDRLSKIEKMLENLIVMQGLTVKQVNDYVYEVVKPSYSADNPIPYTEGMECVDNAFYLKDGKTYVYMNGQFIEW